MNNLTEPLSPLHRECISAARTIRRMADDMKAAVARWQPAPYEPPAPNPMRTPYLDEVARPRRWFR